MGIMLTRAKAIASGVAAFAAAAARGMVSPAAIALVLVLAGCAGVVAGIFILCGLGWSVLAGGVFSMLAGILLLRGVSDAQ